MAATEVPKRYPGESDVTFPEIFTVKPAQPKETKLGQLPQHMIDQFFRDGYVVVEKFFDIEKELNPCREDISSKVDHLAKKLYDSGRIKSLYEEYGLFQRLTMIDNEFPGANILLHKDGAIMPPAIKALWSNERLLNMVEQLIGPNISGHPVWNLRTKTPQNEATTVPWHQDVAYLDNRSYSKLQPTAWIPFLDTTEHNGCMKVASGAHREGKVAQHQCCYGGTWYVMLQEEEMVKSLGVDVKKDIISCPVPYGGMLLINNMTPHKSLSNLSNDIRWSVDLRWQKTGLNASFYEIKDCVEMRSSTNPDLQIDWVKWESVDRHLLAAERVKDDYNEEEEHFDITIQGPWMEKWEMVHMNQHTDKLVRQEATPTPS